MTVILSKYKSIIVAILLLQLCCLCHSQTPGTIITNVNDTIITNVNDSTNNLQIIAPDSSLTSDSVKKTHIKPKPYESMPDSIYDKLYGTAPDYLTGDSLKSYKRHQRALRRFYLKENFLPDPNKSLWYSLTFPGLGQIYNRKYWKLPIVYGCFVGVTYAIVWTSNQYNDYLRGYKEVCDVDPNTNYHLKLLPAGYPESQAETYMLTQLNSFRRYRDLCIVAGVAVYALSIIDAYVDAQLSNFDVSPDLSMKIRPKFDTVSNTGKTALGCQIQLNF